MNLDRCAALAVMALFAFSGVCSGQETTLRYVGTLPVNHFITEASETYAKKVAEKTGGKVKIIVHPTSQLYPADAIGAAVATGAVEMGDNITAVWSNSYLAQLMDLPFLIKSPAHAKRAWARDGTLFAAYDEEMSGKGMKTLFVMLLGSGFDLAYNGTGLVSKPDQLKGMKIRSYGLLPARAIRALGASPVAMNPSDMYLAMSQRTIDGAVTALSSIDSRKLYEVSKFATITSSSFIVFPVNINKTKYDALPNSVKQTLLDAGAEVQEAVLQTAVALEGKSLESIKSKGMQIKVLSPGEQREWSEALKPVVAAWEKDAPAQVKKVRMWIESLE